MKVTSPLTAVMFVVPSNDPVPPNGDAVITVLLSVETFTPNASCTCTTGFVRNNAFTAFVTGGCTAIPSFDAGAFDTVKLLLVPLLNPLALAVNCFPLPALSICKLL